MESLDIKNLHFTDNLIKGKIVEQIFRQLFLSQSQFQIIPLGYEYRLPELMTHLQKPHREIVDKISSQLKNAPDFLLLSKEGDQLFLVEVKYRMVIKQERVLQTAKQVHEAWDYAWLFIASPTGFYFDSCVAIIEKNGSIAPLGETWPSIPMEHMQGYLQILNKYIVPNNGAEETDVFRYPLELI